MMLSVGNTETVPSFKEIIVQKLRGWKQNYLFDLMRQLSVFIKNGITIFCMPFLEKVGRKKNKTVCVIGEIKMLLLIIITNDKQLLFIELLLLIKYCVVKHTLDQQPHPQLHIRISWRVSNSTARTHSGQFSHNLWDTNQSSIYYKYPQVFPIAAKFQYYYIRHILKYAFLIEYRLVKIRTMFSSSIYH